MLSSAVVGAAACFDGEEENKIDGWTDKPDYKEKNDAAPGDDNAMLKYH